MRRIHLLGVVACLALTATACGGGDSGDGGNGGNGGNASADPASVSGTVTYWDTSDATNEAPVFEELIAQFEEQYPNIDVEYVNVPFDQAQNKFKTAAQSGDGAPDVIRAEVAWTPEFASLGYLAPLDGTPAMSNYEDYLAGPAATGVFDGVTYGVPQVTDTLALLYNREIFEQAGVEVPTTWEEMAQIAPTIKDKTGADATYLNPTGYYSLPFIYGEGGDLLDVEGQKITVNSPEAVAGWETMKSLIDEGVSVRPDLAQGYTNMQAAFGAGDVAMVIEGPWGVGQITSGEAFGGSTENLGIAPMPGGSAGAGTPVGGHNYAAYAGSDALDASYLFIEFMNSAESQTTLATELGLLPTRSSVYEADGVAENQLIADFKAVLDGAVARPSIPEAGLLFTPLDVNVPEMIGGEDPQKSLDDVAENYREFLTDWS
ncbi:extracellular solute-binding protein [Allostreptomyces psammosilenae]|uniref:Arabinogalactan oligomer/maltooligosaccharide transport system substrate-binding protein n=1 Tax=Allostreptomyces psammosilenae TaxID=1892865 RepID=A0A852ZRY3_9ACTN|nr:extracellular solute-binding protein [Allostreptomyces psammosilenae]NYI05196.1 arabinogalactan oligomer/maltooligosaccharide transport system substrate-binding protein [Allostreptomyces psammosilenae]